MEKKWKEKKRDYDFSPEREKKNFVIPKKFTKNDKILKYCKAKFHIQQKKREKNVIPKNVECKTKTKTKKYSDLLSFASKYHMC